MVESADSIRCVARFERDGKRRAFAIEQARAHLVVQRASNAEVATRNCRSCGDPLEGSRSSRNRRWKSCPGCSWVDGAEHVFRPYPEAFQPAHESLHLDEAAQRADPRCWACRHRRPPTTAARICSELAVVDTGGR